MVSKVALITGVTGQDGAYLAQFQLDKTTSCMASSADRLRSLPSASITSMPIPHFSRACASSCIYGDMTDSTNLIRIMQETWPSEIYNLAAQSHVQVSFETPEYTANADGLGTLRLLEAIRISEPRHRLVFTRPRHLKLYGQVSETPQCETTRFYPRSPYGAAKSTHIGSP